MIGNNKKTIAMKSCLYGTEISHKINLSMYSPHVKNICRYIITSHLREHNEPKFTKSVTIHHG